MRIIGVDIGAKYIIAHDGSKAVEISTPLEAQAYIRPKDIVVLEQTGAYGMRWAEVFSSLGAKVYIADGRDFKNYRLAHSRKKHADFVGAINISFKGLQSTSLMPPRGASSLIN